MADVEKELEEVERKMSELEKEREDRSKRIMDRRVLQVTTLQELGKTIIFGLKFPLKVKIQTQLMTLLLKQTHEMRGQDFQEL